MARETFHSFERLYYIIRDFQMIDEPGIDNDDVYKARIQELSRIMDKTRDMLNEVAAIKPQRAVVGWRMEFLVCPPGQMHLPRLKKNDPSASEHHQKGWEHVHKIIAFTQAELKLTFPDYRAVKLLNFCFQQPKNWDIHMIGTTLQFLGNRQRDFITQVSPDIYLPSNGSWYPHPTMHPEDPDRQHIEASDAVYAQEFGIEEDDSAEDSDEEDDDREDMGPDGNFR